MAKLIQSPGSSGPVNEGERRVVEVLTKGLADDYWVIPNVEIGEPQGQQWEYDVILVAPHAVYVIETKDWHGQIIGDQREWLVNGSTRKAPTIATERKAKVLKSKLVEHAQVLARVRVEGLVAIASTPEKLQLSPGIEHRVIPLGKLLNFVSDAARIGQRPLAIEDVQHLVIRALDVRTRPRSGPVVFGPYEVIEELEQADGAALYRAKHQFMPGAPPVRLRVSTLSYLLDTQQRQERKVALYREAEALRRMGSHPNVIAAREVFEDQDGRIVTVLDGTEGRSLRHRLLEGTPMTLEERLFVLIDVCRALVHAHTHGVIHRHLEPATILLTDDGIAHLSGFELAKIQADATATVWRDELAEELDVRYFPPELLNSGLGAPGPASDLYQLGCVAYELFTGRPPFTNPTESFSGPPALPESVPPKLGELLNGLLQGELARRPVDAKDVLAALEGLRKTDTPRPGTGPKEQYTPGDFIDGKFQVLERLGGGGFSAVYRVYWPVADQEYALKVFNTQVPFDKIQREFSLLQQVDHPAIVRALWADSTRAGQWYLVTELVKGETLERYTTGEKRLSVQESVEVGCHILRALEAIHPNAQRIAELRAKNNAGEITGEEYDELRDHSSRGIVHRDIKPQNLMLTSNGVVLIDFNIASKVGQQVLTVSGTPRYLSPDIVAGTDMWDVSPDLFAVGVVLYELICCEHPYDDGQPRPSADPRDPRTYRPDLSPPLADFLVKACMPFRGERFTNAREMRLALEAIEPLIITSDDDSTRAVKALPARLQELLDNAPPNVNPMVREFLALSSQARRSNRGTRGMDDLATITYVDTLLDRELSASVLAGVHKLVIITGNAGDGKTAFIQQVERTAKQSGATEFSVTPNGSRLRHGGLEIVTLYDGSQDDADRRSDDVLYDFLEPFADGKETSRTVRLAAINEGRLRDFLLTFREFFPGFATEVIAVLDDPNRLSAIEGLVIVNLNTRSATSGGTDSIFSRQLRKIVRGPFWGPCETCDYRTRCPIKYNVDSFRDSTSGEVVTERLRTLVDLVRLRQRRHLTMRDVRSLQSHILFRDRTCEEVPGLLADDNPFSILDITYFQGVGGLGVPEGSALERGASLLREFDVALVSNPTDDRMLAHGGGLRRMSFPDRSSDYPSELVAVARQQAGSGYDSRPIVAWRAHQAARRQSYFERADDGWWRMLPYRRLQQFVDALDGSNAHGYSELLEEVVSAISMFEGMTDEARARSALWLATSEADTSEFRTFLRFPLGEFSLTTPRLEGHYVEVAPDRLYLVHAPSNARLAVDIDLLEVLERLREGYMPSIDDGRGILVNLSLFKHQLRAIPARELILWTDNGLLRIERGSGEPGSIALMEDTA